MASVTAGLRGCTCISGCSVAPVAIQELANWKALTTAKLYIFRARRKLMESLLPSGADVESVVRFVRLDHWAVFGLEPGGSRFQGLV